MSRGPALPLAGALLALVTPLGARAQDTVELTGDYVRYVAVSGNGVMAALDAPNGSPCGAACVCDAARVSCVEARGMRYSEQGDAEHVTCDAFAPRSIETFTIVAAREDGTVVRARNDLSSAGLLRLEGPTIAGRVLHWAGLVRDGLGMPALRVDLDWTYGTDDHVVRLTTTLTNAGTVTLTEVYALRNADPNFAGLCPASGAGDPSTSNDVVRQPPSSGDALVIAGAGGFFLGIGAHDDRARASIGGRDNSDAVGEWLSPRDRDGAIEDVATDVVVHAGDLVAGDATSFDLFYVWGTSQADVAARFDAAGTGSSTCAGVVDGTPCSAVSGATGVCHASACCTGCWDARLARCQLGTSALRCGAGGVDCATCDDGDACTTDVCGLGACAAPPAPVGAPCEDGSFCTAHDTCDGAGHCRAGVPEPCDDGASCTRDACDEAGDACLHVLTTGCLVGGDCVASGAHPAAYPCLVCDTARSTSDWSAVSSGTDCSAAYCAAGVLFTGGTCDGAGACDGAAHLACETGLCDDRGTACEAPCTSASCGAGERCAASGRCVALDGLGARCAAAEECASGHCADGVCCEEACDGVCAACDLAGRAGRCLGVPAGTDPARECAGNLVCDGHGACTTPGGTDAGPAPVDAAVMDAGGPPPAPSAGCSCTASSRDRGSSRGRGGALLFGVVVLAALRRRRSLALALALATLAPAAPALATTLTSMGFRWDVDDGPFGHGDIQSGTSGAYDVAYVFSVSSDVYTLPSGAHVTTSAAGRQLDLPAAPVGTTGLRAERHVYVPTSATWARFVDVVENPTASPVSASISIAGNLGSDAATTVVTTSSGDAVLDTNDTWLVSDDADGSGTPSLAHVFRGAGGAVGVTFVALTGDQLQYLYAVTVPAHGRVAILHFAVQATSRAAAEAAARQIAVLGPDTRVGADLWAPAIVNWSLGTVDGCASASDGTRCTAWSGANGTCRASACCTGCWDGAACVAGSDDPLACGATGAVCGTCDDGDVCTTDACASGACLHGGAAATVACDDGRFCTVADHCDGRGTCTGGAGSPCDDGTSCTTDACDEATHACTHVVGPGCTIGGECVGAGEHHVAYPCLVCDPARDMADWSTDAAGAPCGQTRCQDGRSFAPGTCDATGTCVQPAPVACASLACADGATCEPECTSTSCPRGTRCGPAHHCVPVAANGGACTTGDGCESGFCTDGLCCERACDGTCESCELPGRAGSCRFVSAGTDPEAECGAGNACDGRGACTSRDAGPRPDAGLDAAASPDGSVTEPTPAAPGCGCGLARSGGWSAAAWAGLGLAVLLARTRRRAW